MKKIIQSFYINLIYTAEKQTDSVFSKRESYDNDSAIISRHIFRVSIGVSPSNISAKRCVVRLRNLPISSTLRAKRCIDPPFFFLFGMWQFRAATRQVDREWNFADIDRCRLQRVANIAIPTFSRSNGNSEYFRRDK